MSLFKAQRAKLRSSCPPQCLPRTLILPLLTMVVVGFLFVIVGPVWYAFHKEGVNSQALRVYCAINETSTDGNLNDANGCAEYQYVWDDDWRNFEDEDWRDAPTFLWMRARITKLDLEAGIAALLTEIYPSGDLYGNRGALNLSNWLGGNYTSLVLIYNNVNQSLQDGLRPGRLTTELQLEPERGLLDYPFDAYNSIIDVQAWASNGNPDQDSYIPIVYQLNTALPAFTLQADTPKENSTLYVSYDMTSLYPGMYIKRSITTQFFSMFIVISMWALSGATFVYVVDAVYLRPRRVRIDDAAFVTALLFALPAVRSAQPGVPAVGASVDVLGFIWNMALAVLCGVIIIAALYAQHVQGSISPRDSRSVTGAMSFGPSAVMPSLAADGAGAYPPSAAPLTAPLMEMQRAPSSNAVQPGAIDRSASYQRSLDLSQIRAHVPDRPASKAEEAHLPPRE